VTILAATTPLRAFQKQVFLESIQRPASALRNQPVVQLTARRFLEKGCFFQCT
jgi:hypothetical protein